jgi:hypothetical protein
MAGWAIRAEPRTGAEGKIRPLDGRLIKRAEKLTKGVAASPDEAFAAL